MESSLIPDDLLRQIIGVGQVDLLVGVHTLEHGDTIGDGVRAVRQCFRTNFPRQRAALLNIDLGSSDGSPLAVQQAWESAGGGESSGLRTTHLINAAVSERLDESAAARPILAAADLLQARTVVVLDPDVAAITPAWISALAAPVTTDDADLVTPIFCRPPAEGLLVTQLMRPLSRAVFSKRMREPLIPEFACSGRLAAQCTQAGWNATQMQRGTHYWITAEALSGPFTVRQCELGMRPLVPRSRAGLPEVFTRVVGSAFASFEAHSSAWMTRSGSEETPTVGACPPPESASDAFPDGTRLLANFAEDVHNLAEVLGGILAPATHAAVVAASTRHRGHRYPDELWANTLADFLVAFHHGVMRRDHITQALLPLYIARTGAFILEHGTDAPDALEAALESLCLCLEKAKARLVTGWEQQHEVQHG